MYICTQSHIQIKIKILHILHWHLGPSHVIIKLLKDKISAVSLISFGNKFHICAPQYLNVFLP